MLAAAPPPPYSSAWQFDKFAKLTVNGTGVTIQPQYLDLTSKHAAVSGELDCMTSQCPTLTAVLCSLVQITKNRLALVLHLPGTVSVQQQTLKWPRNSGTWHPIHDLNKAYICKSCQRCGLPVALRGFCQQPEWQLWSTTARGCRLVSIAFSCLAPLVTRCSYLQCLCRGEGLEFEKGKFLQTHLPEMCRCLSRAS